jgi:DNA repair protein RadA/Sms
VAKPKTQYVCQQCGKISIKPMGRCPQCNAWNSMVEEVLTPKKSGRKSGAVGAASKPHRLTEIEGIQDDLIPLAMNEFARVLGGGIIPGSVVLIGGDPGIGKSTLLLQTAALTAANGKVLYVSGEESARQVKGRVLRVLPEKGIPEEFYLLTETNLEAILAQIESMSPLLVVVDSIQSIYSSDISSSAGSLSQVRECASRLHALAKTSDIATFIVGHVTKEGSIAGPKVLEHIVDTVLYLEGDSFHAYRLLRSVKNRFGATTEVGVFEMQSGGMVEVENPSEIFLAERMVNAPGSTIVVTMEGTRPLVVEIQGLTSATSFGHPRRTANGVDYNRLLLTIAVLTRRVGLKLADQDVFVNVVGGLRVQEPAADLAVAAAVASSMRDLALPANLALIGEIGLSGELRTVPQLDARLKEAAKLGFKRVLVPKRVRVMEKTPAGLEIIPARSVREALEIAFGNLST